MLSRKKQPNLIKKCQTSLHSLLPWVIVALSSFELTACGLGAREQKSIFANADSENSESIQSEETKCSKDDISMVFQNGQRRMQALVASTCVAVTVFQGISQAQMLTYPSGYLHQFTTSCNPWGRSSEIYAANFDQLINAPELSLQREKGVPCASPQDALFLNTSKGANPAGLFASRLLLATLTGVAQFHPDQKLAIPAKYLHWYLSGKGGKKVIDEPELVHEIELAIQTVWKGRPGARGKFLIGYGDYKVEPASSNSIQNSNWLPNELKYNGAHTLPAAHNSLGRAVVNYELIPSFDYLTRNNGEHKIDTIENYKSIDKAIANGKFPANQSFLLAEINDPYSWPAYGSGNRSTEYTQETLGKRGSEGEEFNGDEYFPSSDFPRALTNVLKFLLQDQKGLFEESGKSPGSNEINRDNIKEQFSVTLMGTLSDGTLRAMLGAGARDFSMVKRWLVPVSIEGTKVVDVTINQKNSNNSNNK